ncbi:MAG: tyrosine-type recombinase/integrase, partial [Patescibacteria group bacterium]
VNRFRNAINTKPIYGIRFRTLVEVLLATGMRISEALSLNRGSIDYVQKEARVIVAGTPYTRHRFSHIIKGI